jgi:hypothetical protein
LLELFGEVAGPFLPKTVAGRWLGSTRHDVVGKYVYMDVKSVKEGVIFGSGLETTVCTDGGGCCP